MSKKISDDVNAILQDELRDLRDQVGIYERMLRLDEVPMDDPFSRGCGECGPSSRGPHQHDMEREEGGNHLPELSTFHLSETHTYRGHLTSRLQNYGTDCQGSDEYNDLPSDTNRRRAHFAHSDPVPGAETQPTPSNFGLSDQSGFHSLTRQGVLTSTPALPAHSVMARLRSELEQCLISYKAKREQITKLHETLFTTRCQLHQATEAAQKAEKDATMLRDRVLSLEREVASNRELNETPGPRESALSGQLDRLKQDYAQLESELQTTRSRLQTALGAEARALENEKTASERLAASTAERDAAVDRARAVCEAHYTAMRRRLEVDWANERESIERISEERLSQVRQELTECQAKLDHLTKMYKEAQATTHEAMENALREAMKERESDRMRFWREELPQQLESARQMWEHEWSELRDTAIRQAVDDCEKRLRAPPVTNIGFESVGLSESQSKIVGHVGTSTELVALSTCASQTETQLLLSLSVTDEPNTSSTDPPDIRTRVLHKFLSLGELRSLRIQLLETESINLDTLDGRFHTFLEQQCRLYAEQSWHLIALSFNKLLDEFHLKEVVSSKDDSTDDPSFMNEVFPRALSEYAFLGSEKSDTTAELPRTQSAHHASEDLGNSDFHPSIRDALDSAEPWPIRDKVLLRLRKLVQTLYRMSNTQTQSGLCGQVNKSGQINPDLYQATLGKIKLAIYPRALPSSIHISSLESLLRLIDQVCASTERKFHPDSVFTSRDLHLSGGDESSHPDHVSQVFSPITNSLLTTPNNTPPVSSALQHSLSADVGLSPTGDLQPESSLEFQSVTTTLRKIPSRTHTKLAWIQLQPHRCLSAKSHSPSLGSGAEVGLVQSPSPRSLPPPSIILSCASVSSTQPSNTLHDQLSVIPAPTSTSSRHDRPIPAPRSVKTARPGSEPTYRANFAQLTNDCPDLIHCPTVVCTDPGRRRVHTELYNLFEQFSTPEK
ncbi:putative cation efflux protein/ zinc transporter [Fasciola gigantica]|uniref:Putative cation efflux protein/ zinc transporter n=1 Tax=Fasciola gigantica TaxID=46835 RepID=A0A504YT10_FASGI|nr:putative cation efflux protein/ zinc transporter [Fasciola gigantica]